MAIIRDIINKYSSKINFLDLELIISHTINKPREFVLTHSEKTVNSEQGTRISKMIKRRVQHEPLAYILGHKEFYGLDFKVNKNTLIPRPETELLVDEVLSNLLSNKFSNTSVIDVGTGSGNIIVSLAVSSEQRTKNKIKFYATDISKAALTIARYNAKKHKVDKKIKFLKSNLLENGKLLNNLTMKQCNNLIIVANLPYLPQRIYSSSPASVRKYEPKSALFSSKEGLYYYEELFKQLKKIFNTYYPPATPERSDGGRGILHTTFILEIGPEQKSKLNKLIKQYFIKTKVSFKKDLAGKWRVCKMTL